MLWSKQFFFLDGDNWLDEHHSNPLHTGYRNARNSDWFHMLNADVVSIPDKWEYPPVRRRLRRPRGRASRDACPELRRCGPGNGSS
jgi:hypothetical protein